MADATGPVVVISIFPVTPDRQAELLALLDANARDVLPHRPGFIAARLLTATDGTAVVNYAEWESEQALRDTMADPAVRANMTPAWAIARPVVHHCSIASTHRPD